MVPLLHHEQNSEGRMAKRTYDIRVRNAVARSGDPDLFPDLQLLTRSAR